ncbi:MAG: conjugal transfer protein TraF [Acidobacteria bacterium]|nr:conjugal transfer protein TraF [Acidobacteriota bacterium]
MRIPRWLGSLLLLAVTVMPAAAQERLVYGTRAEAMGGSVVASSRDASAAFGNPAAFAFEPRWDLTFPLLDLNVAIDGNVLATGDAIRNDFDKLSLSNIQTALNSGTVTPAQRAAALDAFLYRVPALGDPGQGLSARASLGPALRFGAWGVSASAFAYGGISPTIDLTTGLSLGTGGFAAAIPSTPDDCGGNAFCQGFAASLVTASGGSLTAAQSEQLVVDAGAGKLQGDSRARSLLTRIVTETAGNGPSLLTNGSGVDVRALLVEQIAGTYSRQILGDRLAAGVSVKDMRGETFRKSFVVDDLQQGKSLGDDLRDRDNREVSSRIGVDLGVLWKASAGLRLGATATNVNAPEFDYAGGGGSFKLERQIRGGAAWSPKGWITVAGDLDLNEIDSQVVNGLKFRYGSVGAEFVVLRFLELRAGGYRNLAASGSPLVYTGGVGFRMGAFELAFSGALSTRDVQRTASNGTSPPATFPSGAGFALSIGWQPRR